MTWPEFAIKHKYTIFALILAIVFFGFYAKNAMKIELFPDTSPPLVNVITVYPGASAEDVAKNLSKPLEEEFATLADVKKIKSSSQDGLSIVSVEFHYGRNVDAASIDVENAISRIKRNLPAGIQEPQVLKFSSSSKPILTLAISSNKLNLTDIHTLAENEIKNEIQLIDGVAAVDVIGGYKRQINVYIDRDKLNALHLSLDQVAGMIGAQNVNAPGGRITGRNREFLLRVNQKYDNVQQLGNTVLASQGGSYIHLKDVARIEDSNQELRSGYRFNGKNVIGLQIIKKDNANTVDVIARVKEEIGQLASQYPGLKFTVADDDSVFTKQVVDNMTTSTRDALILTTIIISLFIISLNESLIVAFSMPLSLLSAIVLMKIFGLSLNIVTLSALILSVGIVVDDAIIVVENIMRHQRELGKDIKTAAIDGASEIMLADVAGTATIVVVLIPLLFISGFVGRLFSPLAKTLIFAISSSLLVSLTIIPLLTVLLGQKRWAAGEKTLGLLIKPFTRAVTWLKELYANLTVKALKNRALTLLTALGFLMAGLGILRLIGMEVLPKMDAGSLMISMQTSPGYTLQETTRVVSQVEKLLANERAVINYSTRIGYEPGSHYMSDTGALGVNQAVITVNLTSRKERRETIWQIEDRLRREIARIPNIDTCVVKEVGGTANSTTAAPIDIKITGEDNQVLAYLADKVMQQAQTVPGTANLYLSWTLNSPQVNITVNENRAAAVGLTPADVSRQIFAAMEGLDASSLQVANGKDTDIVVRYRSQDRRSLTDLMNTVISTPSGVQIPLRDIATIKMTDGASLVTRENLQQSIDVLGYTVQRPLSQVVSDIEKVIKNVPVPLGYKIEITGEKTDLQQSSQSLFTALVIAVVAIYLLLIAQFKSFMHPITIMLSIPLVLFGVAVALLLSGKTISLPAILGLILLAGTVVRNGIVLVDYIIRARGQGMERNAAIVQAVRVRFRPIMMTALANVFGMLPLALEWALGAERFSPLAITVIGGISVATLLTMVVIPVIYSIFDDLANIKMTFKLPRGRKFYGGN